MRKKTKILMAFDADARAWRGHRRGPQAPRRRPDRRSADGGFTPTSCPSTTTPRSRSTAAARSRNRLRRTAADPRNDQLRIRPPRRGRYHRPAGLHAGKARGDHRRRRPPALPGGDRRQGLRAARSSTFPEQAPFPVASPITLFNGPRKDGNPTVFAHAYTTVPVPTTFIVPVVIEKIHKGVYGYRTKAKIPRIASGDGHPDLRPPDDRQSGPTRASSTATSTPAAKPGSLQARGKFTFQDGTVLRGTSSGPAR